MLRLCLVAGARPNFMKIAPLIRAIKKHNAGRPDFFLVHTGQHYDYKMSSIFFKELGIPEPDIFLNIGSGNHGDQTGRIMIAFEKAIVREKADIVVVVGDVNSTVACALVSAKLHIPVAHVEAGLRSFDRTMPEEINRVLTDQLSEYLFTPSPDADENLKKEGIPEEKIFLVGDIMIDNLFFSLPKARRSDVFTRLGIPKRNYALLTLHRPSNVDSKESFVKIFGALKILSKEIPIIFPMHPRTRKMFVKFKLERCLTDSITPIDPLGYFDFLALMSKAKLVLTDSGGIQEETAVLGIPCLTLRDTTERPITIAMGSNVLVHNEKEKILSEARRALGGRKNKIRCPETWDGRTAERIIGILCGSEF